MTTPNEVAGLIDMLSAITVEEGSAIFEHTPEEIGIEVMEHHRAVLKRLSPTEATEPLVERVALRRIIEMTGPASGGSILTAVQGLSEIEQLARAALSSSISNAEAEDSAVMLCDHVNCRGRVDGSCSYGQNPSSVTTTATEDSGEVVQAGAKEPWEVLRDIVTPSPFSHNKAAWSIMLGLIQRDHRLAARQSPDSLVEALDQTTGRPLGDHGTAQQAIEFAVSGWRAGSDDILGQEREFLTAWQQGALDEWPEYYAWLASLSKSPSDGEGA